MATKYFAMSISNNKRDATALDEGSNPSPATQNAANAAATAAIAAPVKALIKTILERCPGDEEERVNVLIASLPEILTLGDIQLPADATVLQAVRPLLVLCQLRCTGLASVEDPHSMPAMQGLNQVSVDAALRKCCPSSLIS